MHAVSAACVVLTSDITIEHTLWVKHAAGAWEAASGSDSPQTVPSSTDVDQKSSRSKYDHATSSSRFQIT